MQASSVHAGISVGILGVDIRAKLHQSVENGKGIIRLRLGVEHFKSVRAIDIPANTHDRAIDGIVKHGRAPVVGAGLLFHEIHIGLVGQQQFHRLGVSGL